MANYPPPGASALAGSQDNSTISAVDASTGTGVWSHFIPTQGYRGGVTTSGNVVFATLSSGDLELLNAQTGALIKDLYIGGPINELATVGATADGTMQVVFPLTVGLVTWGTAVPGDIVALKLQNLPTTPTASTTTTTVLSTVTASGAPASTSTTTTTMVSTEISTSVSGGSSTTLYAVAAVAVIFIIATGYLAMRGRKPGT